MRHDDPDFLDRLEAQGRAIVERLGARCATQRSVRTRAKVDEASFAEARAYQALLVGHVDYARKPAPAAHELAIRRGHVEFILVVLRLMRSLDPDGRADH